MFPKTVILDHVRNIALDPENSPFRNYQAFGYNMAGLTILAASVRKHEREVVLNNPYASKTVLYMSSNVNPFVPCAFNWFSVTVVNYLRLVALVDLMNIKGWKHDALAVTKNKEVISLYCKKYVEEVIPDILIWRNKVAAHFAATDPFKDDTLGTLEQSIMNPIVYKYPYYYVGSMKLTVDENTSVLPEWSLTETFENLRERFWPDTHLSPISE